MRQPISICLNALLLQNHLGGIGNYTYQLSRRLAETHPEWNISLLVHKGVAHQFRDIPGLKIVEINISSRMGRLLFLHLVFPFMAFRYSLLHSVGNMGLVFCPTIQVLTIHDSYEYISPERFPWIKRILMRFLISHSGAKAKHIFVNSQNTRKDVERFYPHLASKISIVYMGNKFPIRYNAGSDNRKHFLFVGTIEPGKNLSLVLQAFSDFHRAYPSERLKVVGAEGWKQSHVHQLIKSAGIQDVVDFLGYVPDTDLANLYSRSLALIQASNYEGFGIPVIEAMACACPVISARNSGLVEAGGDSALFFRTNNREDLLREMKEIYKDSALRERCVQSGFLHAAQFTWEELASKTGDVYRSLLANTDRG